MISYPILYHKGGNMVHIGSWGLPDLGITEFIGGVLGGQNAPLTAQGGSNIDLSQSASTPQVMGLNTNIGSSGPGGAYPIAGGAPTSYNQPTGGSYGGTTGGSTGGDIYQGAPLEQSPQGPDVSAVNAAYDQALGALSQAEGAQQDIYNTAIGQAEASGKARRGEAEAEQTRRLGEYGQQRTRETDRTNSAIAEARRQAAQIIQGLQARFGGTTGTGGFSGELVGSSALQNIGANRVSLQQTLGQISQAENNVKDTTAKLLDQIEQDTLYAKERAGSELKQILADIAGKKGALAVDRANANMQALQNYQSLLSDINARNTQFKQALYQRAQAAQDQVNNFKQSALSNFQATFQDFTPPTFNVGNKTVSAFPSGSGLRGVTYVSGDTEDENQGAGTSDLAASLGF